MKRTYLSFFILFFCILAAFPDSYKLSKEYRPVKISIFWTGFNEEREHTVYDYDKKGRLLKSSIYRGGESPSWYSNYEYDKDNNLIKVSTYSKDGLSSYTTYTYIQNRLYEEDEFDKEGNYTKVTRHEYDEKGNLMSVSVQEVPYGGGTLSWNNLTLYLYDNNNKISEELEYYNGTLNNRIKYEYNNDSLLITTLTYGDLRDFIYRTITSFIYYSNGKNKGKVKELENRSLYIGNGEEKAEVECCTTYIMKPEYDPSGNMKILSFFNCDEEKTGYAVIEWNKGKIDPDLLRKIFERIHWYFTGC